MSLLVLMSFAHTVANLLEYVYCFRDVKSMQLDLKGRTGGEISLVNVKVSILWQRSIK